MTCRRDTSAPRRSGGHRSPRHAAHGARSARAVGVSSRRSCYCRCSRALLSAHDQSCAPANGGSRRLQLVQTVRPLGPLRVRFISPLWRLSAVALSSYSAPPDKIYASQSDTATTASIRIDPRAGRRVAMLASVVFIQVPAYLYLVRVLVTTSSRLSSVC